MVTVSARLWAEKVDLMKTYFTGTVELITALLDAMEEQDFD